MSVVIETTLGDITVDLFLQQRPVTCLNFLKLCKMKYYNFNLFHSIRSGFIAQTGDPTGEGTNGESIFGVLEGPEKRFFSGEKLPKIRHTNTGTLSMVCTGEMMVGSQFFFTLAPDLDSLDSIHCVIGEVTEGHDVLRKLNDVICDESHRPYRDVRITHTVILEDPFNDPSGLRAPSRSPTPTAERLKGGRIAPDEDIDETQGKSAAEIQEIIEEKEAKARATILEIVGDLPDADIAPPENVLFVCKLNPVTTDEDLEIIFSRFGKIVSCEVIRDKKTGDSLQYAFVEFADKKSCEEAYFKMDNVLIDDRRIHVDFSQSVSKMRYLGKGRGVQYFNEDGEGKPSKKDHIRYSNGDFKNGQINKPHDNKDGDRRDYSKQKKTGMRDRDRSRKERSRSRHRKSPETSKRNRSNSRPRTEKPYDYRTIEDRRDNRKSSKSERSQDKIPKEKRLRSPSRSRSNSRSRYEKSYNERKYKKENDESRSRSVRKQDDVPRENRQERLHKDKKNRTTKRSKSRSPIEKSINQRRHAKDTENYSKRETVKHKPSQEQGHKIGSRSRSRSPKKSKEQIKDKLDRSEGPHDARNKITKRSESRITEKLSDQRREIEKCQLSKWDREDYFIQDHKDKHSSRSRSISPAGLEKSVEQRKSQRENESIITRQETPQDVPSKCNRDKDSKRSHSRSRKERSSEQKRTERENYRILPKQETPQDYPSQGHRDKDSRRSRSNSRSRRERSVESGERENDRMLPKQKTPQDYPSQGHRDKYSRSRSNSRSRKERSVEQRRSERENDRNIPRQATPQNYPSQVHKDNDLRRSRSSSRSHRKRSVEQRMSERENDMKIPRLESPQDHPSQGHRDKDRSWSNSRSCKADLERSVEQKKENDKITPIQDTRQDHASEDHRQSRGRFHREISVEHSSVGKSNDGILETKHNYIHKSTTRYRSRSISQSRVQKSQDSRKDVTENENIIKQEQHQKESLKTKSSHTRIDVERSQEQKGERQDKGSHKHIDGHSRNSRIEQSENYLPSGHVLRQAHPHDEERREKHQRQLSVETSKNELSQARRSRSHDKQYESEEDPEYFSEQYEENDVNKTSSEKKTLSTKNKPYKKDTTKISKNVLADKKVKNKGKEVRRIKEKIKDADKKRKKIMKKKKHRDSSSSSSDSSDSSSSSSSSSSEGDRKKKSLKRRKKKLSTSSSSSSSSSESSASSTSSSSTSSSSSSSDSEPRRKKRKKVVSSKASKKGKKK